MKICVFCSSVEGLSKEYYELGYNVGAYIGKFGHTLVFGGYTKGIMGAVANGVRDNGGKVISVIPAIFNGVRPNYEEGAEVIVTDSMSSRKDKMIELSDAFLSLPGGIGTIDEVFQVMALNAVGEIKKPVGIIMQGKSQQKLWEYFETACKEGFIGKRGMENVHIYSAPESVLSAIGVFKK